MPKTSESPQWNPSHVKEWLVVARWFVLSSGIVIITTYCWRNGIMPDGISVGDGFFILFVTIVFGVSLLFSIMIGVGLSFCIFYFFAMRSGKKLRKRLRDRGLAIVSAIDLGIMLLLGGVERVPFDGLVLFCLFMGFGILLLMLFAFERDDEIPVGREGEKNLPVRTRVGVALSVLALITLAPMFQDVVMRSIGIRSSSGQMILISEDDYKRLMEQVIVSGINASFCQMPQSKRFATTSAEVVWHGIGTTSYVRLLDQDIKGKKSILVQIPRNNLNATKSTTNVKLPDWAGFCYYNFPTGKTPPPR